MRRGREDDKVMGPLFPRLHVNDADKGGPRAPPRNKMALYEQLSIPSQRFNSGAAPSLPLPRHASNLVPSASSSQGCGHESSVFSPFYVPSHISTHATERVHNRSDRMNPNAMRMGLEKRSQKHTAQRMVNTAGNERADAECSSSRPHGLSSSKDSSRKKLEDEDDFRVPTFVQSGIAQCSEKDHREIISRFHLDGLNKNGANTSESPIQVQNSDSRTTVSVSWQHGRSNGEGKTKETTMNVKTKENMSQQLEIREDSTKPGNLSKRSSNQECHCGKSNDLDTSHCESASLRRGSSGTFGGPRHLNDDKVMEKQDMLNGRNGSYSKTSLANGLRCPFVAENGKASGDGKATGIGEDADRNGSSGGADKKSLSGYVNKHGPPGDVDRNDDASETSMVDSISGVGISPDDVVGVIGPKHFWKARRAIVNQQRVFALQVFELHRLIKVQKLIAASPDVLLGDSSYLRGSPPKAPIKDPPASSFVKPQQHIDKEKDESYKVNSKGECPEENMSGTPSLHDEDNNSRELTSQPKKNGPCSGNLSSIPATSDKPGSSSFHPPGNQWLVPVISPTEGLIYKPYSGPCPPSGSFMAPMYGGCGALSVPPGAGDYISPAYGVPAAHVQQNMGVLPGAPAVVPNFFPASFGFAVVNPLVSGSGVEQVSSLAGAWPSGRNEQQSRNSCNMSNPQSEALSECVRMVQTARDSDIQGSTASSPGDRSKHGRDALSLFPTASAMQCPGRPLQAQCTDHQSHVIKVVPHNPRTATESAARIFQSIQRERQQYDSV